MPAQPGLPAHRRLTARLPRETLCLRIERTAAALHNRQSSHAPAPLPELGAVAYLRVMPNAVRHSERSFGRSVPCDGDARQQTDWCYHDRLPREPLSLLAQVSLDLRRADEAVQPRARRPGYLPVGDSEHCPPRCGLIGTTCRNPRAAAFPSPAAVLARPGRFPSPRPGSESDARRVLLPRGGRPLVRTSRSPVG
jgi:hypothetical protein